MRGKPLKRLPKQGRPGGWGANPGQGHCFGDIFPGLFGKYTKKLSKYLSIQLRALTFATPIRKLGFDYVSTNQDQITIIRSQSGR